MRQFYGCRKRKEASVDLRPEFIAPVFGRFDVVVFCCVLIVVIELVEHGRWRRGGR